VFPIEAKCLWQDDDLLPEPDQPDFARIASCFLSEHPVPRPEEAGTGAWQMIKIASRQCKSLASLAWGVKESQLEVAHLCAVQAMQIQWMFPVWVGKTEPVDHYMLTSAAGSLALTGGLLQRCIEEHSLLSEVSSQWLRTGLGQLATYGKDSPADLRRAAEALIEAVGTPAGFADLRCSDEEFFKQLDPGRPETHKLANRMETGDHDHLQEAYLKTVADRLCAIDERRGHVPSEEVCLDEADDLCRNVFILKAHMHKRHDFGSKVDWAAVIDDDIESRVWMNAHLWTRTLLDAYRRTGDDKYVVHLCRLLNSWYETSPPPFERGVAQWRTLEAGGRPARWVDILLSFARHPVFQERALFNMARSMLDHGKYLCMYAASGCNWLQVESIGLITVALLFPEFRLSKFFYYVGMNRLMMENSRSFLPDGFHSECSAYYHCFPTHLMTTLLDLSRSVGVSPPERLAVVCERAHEAAMHISWPNGNLPHLNDSGPRQVSVRPLLSSGAKVFNRSDFAWIATSGRKGSPPVGLSRDFSHAGYCVMRSGWDENAHVLIFDAGNFGAGHQHEDKLSFVYYAFGRELIGDPGIYSYRGDEFEPYWRGTWGHNSVIIDGLSQHRALGPKEQIPDPDRRFVTEEAFDFAVGWFRRAYSPRRTDLWGAGGGWWDADLAAANRTVQHQRCIFFLRGRYAIICDRILGEGEHLVDVVFHPAAILDGEKVRPVRLEVNPDGSVVTVEDDHANVAILPADVGDVQVLDLIGQKDPVRGWVALYGICPSHDIVYRYRRQLPAHFATAVQPLGGKSNRPMKVTAVDVRADDKKPAIMIRCGSDLFALCYDGPARMRFGNVDFHGTAMLLEREADTTPTRVHLVDGRSVTIAGKIVFSSDNPPESQSIDLLSP